MAARLRLSSFAKHTQLLMLHHPRAGISQIFKGFFSFLKPSQGRMRRRHLRSTSCTDSAFRRSPPANHAETRGWFIFISAVSVFNDVPVIWRLLPLAKASFSRQTQSSKLLGVQLNSCAASDTRCPRYTQVAASAVSCSSKGSASHRAVVSTSLSPFSPKPESPGWMGMPWRRGQGNPQSWQLQLNEAYPGLLETHPGGFLVTRICQRGKKPALHATISTSTV